MAGCVAFARFAMTTLPTCLFNFSKVSFHELFARNCVACVCRIQNLAPTRFQLHLQTVLRHCNLHETCNAIWHYNVRNSCRNYRKSCSKIFRRFRWTNETSRFIYRKWHDRNLPTPQIVWQFVICPAAEIMQVTAF